MNSRSKTALAAAAGFVAFWPPIAGLEVWIVRPSFQKLLEDRAIQDGTRASAAIRSGLRQSGDELGDWAAWDDARAFTGDRDPAFGRANLGDRR